MVAQVRHHRLHVCLRVRDVTHAEVGKTRCGRKVGRGVRFRVSRQTRSGVGGCLPFCTAATWLKTALDEAIDREGTVLLVLSKHTRIWLTDSARMPSI